MDVGEQQGDNMLTVTTPIIRAGAGSLLNTAFIKLNTQLVKWGAAAFAFSGEDITLPEGVKDCVGLVQIMPASEAFRGGQGFENIFGYFLWHADNPLSNSPDGKSSLLIFKKKSLLHELQFLDSSIKCNSDFLRLP
jgi:hypothetical protein